MLFAYTKEKEMIPASESHEDTSFYCPDCGERLIRKVGKVKIPHFAHRCSGDCHGLSEGETPEHLELKQLFFSWGNQFEDDWKLESPLSDLPQRPDLLQNKLAVEIQCSSIKGARLVERMAGYRQQGYKIGGCWERNYGLRTSFQPCKNNFVPLIRSEACIFG